MGSKNSSVNIDKGEYFISIEEPSEEELKTYAFNLLNNYCDNNPSFYEELLSSMSKLSTVKDPLKTNETVTKTIRKQYLRKCRGCGWAGWTQRDLDIHKSIHTEMDRSFKCKYCNKTFFDIRNLKGHEKKNKFQCVYCDKFFRMESYLEKHLELHKEAIEQGKETSKKKKTKTESQLLPTPVKKQISCKQCKRIFYRKTDMKIHMKSHKQTSMPCTTTT